MLGNKLEVAVNSLHKINEYKESNNFGRAFAHFLVYLELCPNTRNKYEKDFRDILFKWVNTLEEQGRIREIGKCYFQALYYFPSNVKILTHYGAQLLRLEHAVIAEKYLTLALKLDSNYLPAEKNLTTAKINLVPRWHFRMLNDKDRNEAYFKAIRKAVSNKVGEVIDIGAGSGILSCFAAQSDSVVRVLAVENSKVMSSIMNDVLAENNIEKVLILNKMSTDINFLQCDKFNILVTETFDVGLFGEHVLHTLLHAWNYLLNPSATIIPAYADLFIVGVSTIHIGNKHRFCNGRLNLNLGNICILHKTDEPYEAEKLQNEAVTYITSVEKIVQVNFSDVKQLMKLCQDPSGFTVKLNTTQNGTIDAFAIWFELYLDEEFSISTSPFVKESVSWEQAIFHLDHKYNAIAGESFDLNISCTNNKLQVFNPFPTESDHICFYCSQNVMTFMNDENITTAINQLISTLNCCDIDILDLCPFPLFAFNMAKKKCKTWCIAKTEEDNQLFKHIAKMNGCEQFFHVVLSSTIDDLLATAQLFDIIFINPISEDGTLCEEVLINYNFMLMNLKPNGMVLPRTVTLHFEVIESEYLEKVSRVSDANTCGLKIAEQINKYMVLEHWMSKLDPFPYKALADPVEAINILESNGIQKIVPFNVELKTKGKAVAVSYWFQFSLTDNIGFSTNACTHYGNACFFLETPKVYEENQILQIYIKQHKGLLKIFSDKDI